MRPSELLAPATETLEENERQQNAISKGNFVTRFPASVFGTKSARLLRLRSDVVPGFEVFFKVGLTNTLPLWPSNRPSASRNHLCRAGVYLSILINGDCYDQETAFRSQPASDIHPNIAYACASVAHTERKQRTDLYQTSAGKEARGRHRGF